MNSDLIEIVDMFQQYTIGPLSKKHVYQLYLDFLPKAKMFAKYIKGKKMDKYNKELVKIISDHYKIPKLEAEDYVGHFLSDSIMRDNLTIILKMYG